MPKNQKDSQSATSTLYSGRTEETLNQKSKSFRDSFVREYIKDFKPAKALIRCGYQGALKSVYQRASNLLRETYVQVQLDRLLRALRPEDVVTRQQVMAKMWEEANDDANEGAVRVAATAHVAKMLGMMKQADDNPNLPVGVMLIPCVAIEDWQETAIRTQTLLKQQSGLN